jgi:hypothetical protein
MTGWEEKEPVLALREKTNNPHDFGLRMFYEQLSSRHMCIRPTFL